MLMPSNGSESVLTSSSPTTICTVTPSIQVQCSGVVYPYPLPKWSGDSRLSKTLTKSATESPYPSGADLFSRIGIWIINVDLDPIIVLYRT